MSEATKDRPRQALLAARHALDGLHNARATDLMPEAYDTALAQGVPREQLEWVVDVLDVLALIEQALDDRPAH